MVEINLNNGTATRITGQKKYRESIALTRVRYGH